jgi:hypothetical protein
LIKRALRGRTSSSSVAAFIREGEGRRSRGRGDEVLRRLRFTKGRRRHREAAEGIFGPYVVGIYHLLLFPLSNDNLMTSINLKLSLLHRIGIFKNNFLFYIKFMELNGI